ncbi:MAG: transcriptional regulator [Deltaproteobacteria bacterium]|nr:helix-turn-helix transcriptional regulator [Deltaproteobacteria bacterium]RLC11422.1 MAG: transcriptional regulator [Deltaproteobacteria bacterium]
MADNSPTFPELVKEVRRQLGISQEELAHELGVSFATINRWENGKTTPFKLARGQFDAFCKKMTAQGKLHLGNSSEK